VPGYLPDVRSALASATVFVASMRSGRGVKNKVLEAMAAGLPVVATSLALNGIGTSAGVVAADTAEEQAAAVLHWLADPDARERAGRANRECVLTQHTWAASAAVVEAIWADACTSTS
jgi:glycosyltransferase involved in cell wall biosynthesis